MAMPYPCITVGELIESLSCLDPDAPLALIEVSQDWNAMGGPPVTTLTLKSWGGLTLPSGRQQAAIQGSKKALPAKQARIECSTSR